MFYVILGLTIVVMFIVLVIAFSYADRHNSDDEYENNSDEDYEWED